MNDDIIYDMIVMVGIRAGSGFLMGWCLTYIFCSSGGLLRWEGKAEFG